MAKNDTSVSHTNGYDLLNDKYYSMAYIDEATTLTGAQTFNFPDNETLIMSSNLSVEFELGLRDSTIGDDFDVAWVLANTIPMTSVTTVDITGNLKFTGDLTISADSTTGSLGQEESSSSFNIPEDLIFLNTSAIDTTFDNGK